MLEHIWGLIKITFYTFTFMVTDLRYILIMAVVFVLVYRQYAKILQYEQGFFRLKRINPLMETVTSLVYGIGGGILATMLFLLLGVSVSDAGVAYLWLAALLLMLVNQRFLCFAYAGSLVSLIALVTGFPQVHVPTLMALVAVLHLVESFLIFVNGYHNASPMFFKHESGKVVGGFALRKFWPMPTIALVGVIMISSGVDFQSVPMPDWWPIFEAAREVPDSHVLLHVLFPLIVALGYSDFVQTELPKTKARRSAGMLTVYSLILLGLAVLANAHSWLAFLPVLFAPFGHELVIHWGRRREKENAPVFLGEEGVMVLAVYPNSPAEQMGLEAGDVIRSINGVETENIKDLADQMSPWIIDPVFVVENQFREPTERKIAYKGKVPPLGIVPAPHPEQGAYVRFKDGYLKTVWSKWKAKRK
ncbi:MAG TPA: PDZ domain-containing protein [Limnochordia bacterium]|nr:PDZ domain-containing protein [Limnochordia bacterium]